MALLITQRVILQANAFLFWGIVAYSRGVVCTGNVIGMPEQKGGLCNLGQLGFFFIAIRELRA